MSGRIRIRRHLVASVALVAGGTFMSSPAMYEMDGKQYVLIPAAAPAGGPADATNAGAPMGWVAYALPSK